MHKKIAVLAGDGIGPEVMQATLSVLDTVAQIYSHQFEYIEAEIGGAAYEKYGVHCPDETLEKCAAADAILFGSVGGSVALQHLPKWKGCEANSILKLRDYFDLNINIRPIKVLPALKQLSPLSSTVVGEGFDCVIFRELTGGTYFGAHEQGVENAQRVARDESVYSEEKIRQIARHAFNAAKSRGGRLCSVDKANVLATSKLWREVVNEVGSEYPDVELTHMLVDNCAMQLVLNPQQFDVIVTENMFGDILSDLAAALPGSVGLIPSASLNQSGVGLYEPSGGSAPEIAGRGVANPTAQILSAAMMLRYSFGLEKEARAIEEVVYQTIARGVVTADLASGDLCPVGTLRFSELVSSGLG